jgi:hypothetical protein
MFLLTLLLMLGCSHNSVAVSVSSCIFSTCWKYQYMAVLHISYQLFHFLSCGRHDLCITFIGYVDIMWSCGHCGWQHVYTMSFSLKRIYQHTDQIFNLVNMVFPFLLSLIFRIHMDTWETIIFDGNIIVFYKIFWFLLTSQWWGYKLYLPFR